jgi:hypothetical protein
MANLEERIAELERRIAVLEGRGNGEVAEDQPKYRKVTDRDPRVGDYVKFDEAPRSYLTAGKYYEIFEIDDYGDPQIIDDDGDDFDTGGFEFEVYELVAEGAPKLKVGDYAKVISRVHTENAGEGAHEFEIGEIVKLIEADSDYANGFTAESLHGARWFIVAEDLAKATDEEIRWAKIGRKPGEFKKGDIVRVKDEEPWFETETIGEVEIVCDEVNPCIRALDYRGKIKSYYVNVQYVELICPVEHRFDREGVNA